MVFLYIYIGFVLFLSGCSDWIRMFEFFVKCEFEVFFEMDFFNFIGNF